jgi:hypothetical protein
MPLSTYTVRIRNNGKETFSGHMKLRQFGIKFEEKIKQLGGITWGAAIRFIKYLRKCGKKDSKKRREKKLDGFIYLGGRHQIHLKKACLERTLAGPIVLEGVQEEGGTLLHHVLLHEHVHNLGSVRQRLVVLRCNSWTSV